MSIIQNLFFKKCKISKYEKLIWNYEKTYKNELNEFLLNGKINFIMNKPSNIHLLEIKRKFNLEKEIGDYKNDFENDYKIVIKIAKWVSKRWKHDGYNEPSKSDPLTILTEAQQGKQFRCVEYAIVMAAISTIYNIPSRVVGLMRKDVETADCCAGHVVVELFLKNFNKWIMVDPQFCAIFEINKIPLNCIELQKAITENNKNLKLKLYKKASIYWKIYNYNCYKKWIYSYLFYFKIIIDQRFYKDDYSFNISSNKKMNIEMNKININKKNDFNNKPNKKIENNIKAIILGPAGYKKPEYFQKDYKIKNAFYINNPDLIY